MKWTKPNGSEVETNEEKATIEHCESLGWKSGKAKQPKKQSKKD